MYDYEDKELKKVGLELMFMTPEKGAVDNWITAVELAKMVELPVEIVKKKLTILKDADIVRLTQSIGNLITILSKEWMRKMRFFNSYAVLMM